MKNRYLLLTVFLSCLVTESLAQPSVQNTPAREWREWFGTDLGNCKPSTAGDRICEGFGGYSLLLKGDEKRPQIFLIAPDRERHRIHYWDLNDPRYRSLNKSVSWVVVNTPKKTIAIDFHLKVEPRDDYTEWDAYDIIVRVSPGPVCVVGTVPSVPSSAATAVAIANNPTASRCLGINELQKRDWFLTTRRLARQGKIQLAKSALEHVKGYGRFINYREISNAQYKAGDAAGARHTLMTARAEAFKNASTKQLRFTLSHVVLGLVDAGFYEAAKADVNLFHKSERLGMYLSIAWAQAERNDLEAAKTTYSELIELEMSRTPRPELDWNLARICDSQARLQLFDEAKRTASLIQNPDAKRSAEDRLPKQP